MGVLMMGRKPSRKEAETEPPLISAEAAQLVDAVQLSGKSSGGKIIINREANGIYENGHMQNGHQVSADRTDGSSTSNSSDEGDGSTVPSIATKTAKALRSKSSWSLRRPRKSDAEAEEAVSAEPTAGERDSRPLTDGRPRRKSSVRNLLRGLKPPAAPSPFESSAEQAVSRNNSVREEKRKSDKAGKQAQAEQAKLDDAANSQSFTVEGSLSSATTSRAHSFEAGEGALGQEAGTAGKAGAAGERRGHSRSRSWVAAVTAPFARSASGALKPSDEGDSGKGEKPTHTPRSSIDGLPGQSGQLPTPPPTPEQPKQLGSAISCLNIFPGSKGSASDGEFETIEASKASSLKYPAPLPPLKNIGNTCFMNANLQMLLHAPPVQATLCSMPVPPPESEGPPTPRAEEAQRSGANPSLLPGSTAGGGTLEPHAPDREAAADAPTLVEGAKKVPGSAFQVLSSLEAADGVAAQQAQQAPALAAAASSAAGVPACCGGLSSHASAGEKPVLAPIAEHARLTEGLPAAEPLAAADAEAPQSAEISSLPAISSVKTCAACTEDAAPEDADSDSTRSHTPVSVVGADTPDIAHPPSAVESLQRAHQPWSAARAPAALLQDAAAGAASTSSSAHPGSEASAAEGAAAAGAESGSACDQAERVDTGRCSPAEAGEAQAKEGATAEDSAAPPLVLALPKLKPGELFRAFRRFAHETLSAPPDEAVNPEALVKTFFRTEIGTPFSNGGQHDTEESLREFMRALEADMAACHSREDECLVGDDCLCKVARTTKPLNPLATAPVPGTAPAEPIQALSKQPSAPAPKVQKPKDAKKAEEADKKAKEAAKKKEDTKKGEEAEKKAKDAEEARRREADKGHKRWAQDTTAKLPFEMLFTGQEQSSSTCPKCGSMSTMYDVSTMLTLSLTKKYEGWWAAMLARKAPLTLQDCLQGYTQEETLPADDFVMCDECKEKTKDRKALKLHRLPEVLLIMLKRTMYPSTEKDDRHITFPLEGLDLAPYLSEAGSLENTGPCTYDLAGVCAHDGKSVNCGHYRAVCRRPASGPEEQDAWYMYDDDKPAQLLKPEQVSSQTAYVLCYCRSSRGGQEGRSA